MSDARAKAGELLGIALSTYREDILPDLPADKRYTGAMVANALGIAQRRLSESDPAGALLKELGGETLAALASDIRSGRICDQSHERLAATLLDYLRAELRITNPRFLQRREA